MTATALSQTLPASSGSVIGGVFLISGSCIGVGMLALPILTGFAGFLPTLATFAVCWIFMTATALLLIETNLWFSGHSNFISLCEKTLGSSGKVLAWMSFLFLFYSLVVAYISKGGDIVQFGCQNISPWNLPSWTGRALITATTALFVFCGPRQVDLFNRLCMAGLFIAYFYLLGSGVENSNTSLLQRANWNYTLFMIPFIITSFGFHNMISSLAAYLGRDQKKLSLAVILGSIVPFVVFVLWILKIQSMIPLEGPISLSESYRQGEISTEPLARIVQNSWIGSAAELFAFFAIITSLLGQGLSIFDFFSDGLRTNNRILLCLLTFLPPFFFAQAFPNIFFTALELAGGIAAMILFGILPSMMVWKGRYHLKFKSTAPLPGGRVTLAIIFLSSLAIVIFELQKNIIHFIT